MRIGADFLRMNYPQMLMNFRRMIFDQFFKKSRIVFAQMR